MGFLYRIGLFLIGAFVVSVVMLNKSALDTREGTPSRLLSSRYFNELVESVKHLDPTMGRVDGFGCKGTTSTDIDCYFIGQKKVKIVLQSPQPVPEFVMIGKSENGVLQHVFSMGLPDLLNESQTKQYSQAFSNPKIVQE